MNPDVPAPDDVTTRLVGRDPRAPPDRPGLRRPAATSSTLRGRCAPRAARSPTSRCDRPPGSGVVDSWTLVHRAPRPDVETPYVVARVRLDEGPILLTQLLGEHDWTIDDEVVVDWHDLADGRSLPVFRRP